VRTVEFRRFFDDRTAARVYFELERDRVLSFVVQLECLFNGDWSPIVRFNTAHGFPHRDTLHPSGEIAKTELPARNYNEALTFAIQDLSQNWERYRRRYEQWLEK